MFSHRFRRKKIRTGGPERTAETKGNIFLSDLEGGQSGIISDIAGGRQMVKRLADLGLAKGVEVEMLSTSFFSGPVQIKVCGSRLVIGRGLASKIVIERK